jgi:branched-chain amino acid transport system permease protein
MYRRLIYGLLLALVIAAPFVLQSSFLRDLLIMSGIYAILTLSLDVIVSGMGQFSFGHQAFFAIGAYTSALLSVKLGVPPFVSFFGAAACAGLVGLLIGSIALRALRGVYLAIVTLGFSVIMLVLTRGLRGFTGGESGILRIPPPTIPIPGHPDVVFGSEFSYYYIVLICLLLVLYLISRWQHSWWGRAVTGLREHEALANSIGIVPITLYGMAFAFATAIAGLSGALFAHYQLAVYPSLFNLQYMFLMLVMLFVGGKGTLGGPILGAVFFIFVPKFLPIKGEMNLLLFGGILLLTILFMQSGVYPALVSLGHRLMKLFSGVKEAETEN